MSIKHALLIYALSNINSTSLAANMSVRNAHQFSFQSISGEEVNLSDFKGKVILIVNTASKCGFTPQYQGLQNLHEKYQDRGLIVIGVPSADFANQKFSQTSQVKEFTRDNYSITFPLTMLNKVKGPRAHPFYLWANNKAGFFGSPKWNFHKYLIDKNGNLAGWFTSTTKPESVKIISKIEELL